MELTQEKRTRTQFGSVTVINPELVVRIGLSIAADLKIHSIKIWAESEYKALERGLEYDPRDIFYSEEVPGQQGKIFYQFRYYTPISNRLPPKRHEAKILHQPGA